MRYASRFCIPTTLSLLACGPAATPPAAPRPPAGTVQLTAAQLAAAGVTDEALRFDSVALPLRVSATVVTPEPLSARVGSIVDGRVERVAVLPGDRVAGGAPLVYLHSRDLADAQRDLASASAELAFARAASERSERLLAAEAVSREEVERRRTSLDQAEAQYARSRDIVRNLSPSAEGEVTVRAPRAGTVYAVHVRPGEAVVTGEPMVDMGDGSRLWVTGWIPENASVHLSRGALAQVELEAMPGRRVSARVVRVGGVVDSLRRAVEIRAELADVPPGVRPGMFASLILPRSDVALRAVLPADAVQRTPAGDVVFVAEGEGRYRATAVTAVPLDDGRYAVAGLPPGLRTVTRGAYALRSQLGASAQQGD